MTLSARTVSVTVDGVTYRGERYTDGTVCVFVNNVCVANGSWDEAWGLTLTPSSGNDFGLLSRNPRLAVHYGLENAFGPMDRSDIEDVVDP